MKKYCVDLEIAKELKEAQFPQETEFFHEITNTTVNGEVYKRLVDKDYGRYGGAYFYYSAPTSDEILKELPFTLDEVKTLTIHKAKNEYYVNYQEYNKHPIIYDKKLVNALAKMWLYLKKEGYIK